MTTEIPMDKTTDTAKVSTAAATPLIPLPEVAARALTVAGTAVALMGTFLAWTWTEEFPGNLTVTGYPGGLQVLTLVGSLLTLLFALSGYGIRGLGWLTPGGKNSPVLLAALGVFGATGYSIGAITQELGGLVNLEPGAWVAGIGALIAVIGALGLPVDQPYGAADPTPNLWGRIRHSLTAPDPGRAKDLPSWVEILIIAAGFGVGLYVFAYGIGTEYSELFIGFLIVTTFGFTAVTRAGLLKRLSALTAKHRNVSMAAAFVAAICFPSPRPTTSSPSSAQTS